MAKRLELSTPAKINLFLRITGRRPDGYHELDSLFLPVSLFDRVVVEAEEGERVEIAIQCNWPHLPLDDRNLAYRAARLFVEERNLRWQVKIDLHKRIPDGAGLGGGSSDAGAVLRIMAQLNGIAPASLAPIALRLGADVPFFLDPRPARVGGIGERIAYLEQEFALHMVIGVPPVAVPTAEIYRHLEQRDWSGCGPAIITAPSDPGRLPPDLLVNDLERPALALYPQIAAVRRLLHDVGAAAVLMSGSGGAVFGLFATAAEAAAAMARASAKIPSARFYAADVTQGLTIR
jgi:4-diphosphocytidyl-2-C-methyl-D-erythritol kinase